MSGSGQAQSASQRLWSWALGMLVVAIVAQVAWALLAPLVPVLVVAGLVWLALGVVRRRREW